ncbi:transcription cofactor vestigial-like protein 4 [Myxocyprinus asiaticus]|uniref:transcription cofactor vestigial-like protein 4 n=1 Tax=Myxocyprinus asiaticus TaxID=70543 RepID=UPI002221C96E|nr:transcription cofactor vestigial-like protein 4 [Myxocyprinus asiaticus]
MDLLIHQFINKMNNNISRLHYNSYEDDSGTSRVHVLDSGPPPVSPTKRKHHDDHDSDEEHMNKMSRLLASHLRNPNGDTVIQESWNRSSFEHTSLSGLHNHHVFAPFPIFAMEQPLALTKQSSDLTRSTRLSPGPNTQLQQNRPSVITCAPASSRTCSLSSCHMSPNSCISGSTNKTNANTVCDPVIEEHFRRSLGDIYKEPEPSSNSVSITGSVDDHFTKALGDTWLQIKARGHGPTTPQPKSS